MEKRTVLSVVCCLGIIMVWYGLIAPWLYPPLKRQPPPPPQVPAKPIPIPIPKDLLDILACAFCKSDLRAEAEKLHCVNKACGLVYAVKDGIPIMLIDEAERPCPSCATTREWNEDILKCPKCGATLKYERKQGRLSK